MEKEFWNKMKIFFSYILFFIFVIILSSCYKSKVNTTDDNDSIFVYFYTCHIESSIRKTYKELRTCFLHHSVDSIIQVESKYFNEIKGFLTDKKYSKENKSYSYDIYMQMDTIEMCLSNHMLLACDKNERSVEIDDRTLYLILWKIGFYNYLTKEDLHYDVLINKYGIPKDYHHINTENILSPRFTTKVILVRK